MAREIGNVTVIDGDEIDGIPENTHDEALADLLDQVRGESANVKIWVYREGTGQRQMPYVCQVPVDKYDLASLSEHLRTAYGPGDYRLHFRRVGQKGIMENKLLCIDPGLREFSQVAKTANANNPNDFLQGMALLMQQQQQQFMQMLETLKAPNVDPRENMTKDLAMLAQMKAVFGGGEQARPVSALESMKEVVALLAGVRELVPMLGGGGGGESAPESLISLAGTFGPKLLELVSKEQELKAAAITTRAAEIQRRPNPAPRQAAVVTPTGAPVEPAAPPAPDADIVRQAVAALVPYAAGDIDPAEVAAQMLQQPGAADMIAEILAKPNPFKYLVSVNNAVLDNAGWWVDLIAVFTELTGNGGTDIKDESQAPG